MKFKIDRWRREFDEFGGYRDLWEYIGTEDILYDSEKDGHIIIGCKDSGLHIILHSVFNVKIEYHYIYMDAFSKDNKTYWKIRLY